MFKAIVIHRVVYLMVQVNVQNLVVAQMPIEVFKQLDAFGDNLLGFKVVFPGWHVGENRLAVGGKLFP